jgi:glutamate-ammonia-ligase adenylyltransferase
MNRSAQGLQPARFGVIAYGKLGGIELGYGSDLDLIFIHDGEQGACTDGKHPLENSVFFNRLARRIIHFLSIPTTAGVLYRVDTRLRPNGSAGLLVSPLSAFARYQREHAWVWEHQALLRARPVAGSATLGATFNTVRRNVLCQPRDAAELAHAVREMRARMRRQHGRERRGSDFDIKHSRGGLIDLEFLVQYWVLRWARDDPAVVCWTDNMRMLDALIAGGHIERRTGRFLQRTYRAYRARLHRLDLAGLPGVMAAERAAPLRHGIVAIWDEVFR